MAVLASSLADYLLRTQRLNVVQTRKIFTTFATMTPGFLMILQVFYGYDRTWSVAIFTMQLFLNGAVTAGYLGNGLDIAPNFSGTIFGMANTVSSLGGYLSTYMVGTLTAKSVCLNCVVNSLINFKLIFLFNNFPPAANLRILANCLCHPGYVLHRWLACIFDHGQRWNSTMEQSTRTQCNRKRCRRSRSTKEKQWNSCEMKWAWNSCRETR